MGGPVILAGGQAYTIQGNYAVPAHTDVSSSIMSPLFGPPLPPLSHPLATAAVAPTHLISPFEPMKQGHLQAAMPPAHLLTDVSFSEAEREREIPTLNPRDRLSFFPLNNQENCDKDVYTF